MNITRRAAIRNILIVTAGAAILPSCFHENSTIKLNFLDINRRQEDALASLSDTIIPKTDTPGARDISAHLFVLKMVDDCYTKEEQQTFLNGFHEFEALTKEKYNKAFDELSALQKNELLTNLEKNDKTFSDNIKSFYGSAKSLTLLGFTTSKYYLTEVKNFNLIPGKYEGSVLVQNLASPAKS
ncbi:MAG: gluconate 2-dehydrogenase subunit 3 family protein [Daejeonella sp.]